MPYAQIPYCARGELTFTVQSPYVTLSGRSADKWFNSHLSVGREPPLGPQMERGRSARATHWC